MSALAYADKTTVIAEPTSERAARPGFWRRLFDAIVESRRREVERQVNAYLIRNRLAQPNDRRAPEESWKRAAEALPF